MSSVSKFTFHYASTLSLPFACFHFFLSVFTFHYASTLSVPSLTSLTYINIFTFHYASTLSATPQVYKTRFVIFTFHYASTLSRSWQAWFCYYCFIYIPLCFYFILLALLYRSALPIYIPLCFYFISFPKVTAFSAWSNLHSTMLLLYPLPTK